MISLFVLLYAFSDHIQCRILSVNEILIISAHKLTRECLNPSSTSHKSPPHGFIVFHESTSLGLQYYAKLGCKITSQIVSFINNLWKMLSIKSPKNESVTVMKLEALSTLHWWASFWTSLESSGHHRSLRHRRQYHWQFTIDTGGRYG